MTWKTTIKNMADNKYQSNISKIKYSLIIMVDVVHSDTMEMIESLYHNFSDLAASFEMIVINNGASPSLQAEIHRCLKEADHIKYIEFITQTVEAVCLKSALKESAGDFIVIYGTYQQITNQSLLKLLEVMESTDADIISPWRQRRIDNRFNQLQSKFYNALVNIITGTRIHDLGCKVKVLRREVLENTNIYGDLYPYLPVLAEMKGYHTTEVKCAHYKDHGKTGIYGISMYFNRLVEILTLYFNTRFTRKPLRFFSAIGVGFLLVGMIITAYVFADKILFGTPIGDRPLLLLAILFAVIGIQAASVGLLGEIIAFAHGRHKKEYSVREII